jgi:hypothetical protein
MGVVNISPEFQRIFEQLRWLDRRRKRIVDSVSSHFSKETVQSILAKDGLRELPVPLDIELNQLIDERDPDIFLRDLANEVEAFEGRTINALRKHTSVYQSHVDEQIHFGARNAGQDAGRQFLASYQRYDKKESHLEPVEAVQAVFVLTYNGFPNEKNYFLSLRSHGGSTVHFQKSPHLKNWQNIGGDPKFLHQVKIEWMKGILDILAPNLKFTYTQSIEAGSKFGLLQFYAPEIHANP